MDDKVSKKGKVKEGPAEKVLSKFELAIERMNKLYNFERKEAKFISTDSIDFDTSLGGGISTGRISELMAWEGAGKSTIALHLIKNAQKMGMNVAYVDGEGALDEKYARAIGVDWDALLPTVFQPMTGEEAFDYGKELINTGELGLLIYDSTSSMIPKKQLEDPAGSHNLGLQARLFSAQMPIINSGAVANGTAVVFISQMREKIGVLWGSPETTQAGNALKFFASNRIMFRRSMNKEGKEEVNQTTTFKVLKCKNTSPFGTGEFDINFGEGIDRDLDLLTVAVKYDVIQQGGSWFSYGDSKIGQGKEKAKTFLSDNPEFADEIRKKVLDLAYGK